MSDKLSTKQAIRVMTDDFGMTLSEAARFLMFAEIFSDVRIELEHREPLTVSYRKGWSRKLWFREWWFTIQGGETVREVESLDEQALQEQAQFQADLFPEDPPEDSWEPSPPEAFRVFQEYDDLTGEFDE